MNCLQLSLAAWTHAHATGIKNIIFVLSSCYPAHYHPQGVIICNKTGRIIVIIPLSHYPILEIYYAELWVHPECYQLPSVAPRLVVLSVPRSEL